MSGAEGGHHDQHATLQGSAVDLSTMDAAARMEILEKAFDFRGDVTLTLPEGKAVSGYLFDRRKGKGLADSVVRVMPADSEARISIAYANVLRIEFGKDAAHGKSFETWVKKYVEKKMKGEKASIESEEI